MCDTPWVPASLVSIKGSLDTTPATHFRGGAGSDKEWSDGSSAHTAQEDATVKIQAAAPTQESLDEIDALSRPSTATAKPRGKGNEIQAAASGMMKEHGKLEILHTTAKHELESTRSIITTMKVQQEAEQKVYESRIQRLKARETSEFAPSDDGLRKQLAVAKERVTFLEKAYKEKSEALKAANASSQKAKTQDKTPKPGDKKADIPKWGFEPPDDLPHSQPYWDYRNAYSDHIAAMVAATVSTIPHIPLASAISTAISTVSKAGPPPQLTQKGKGRRGSNASRPTSPAPSQLASPPVIPKPSPPPVLAHAKLTMAQMRPRRYMWQKTRKSSLGVRWKQVSK
ncbi:hypothetical protein AX14_002003 [Amanita brunnescens Koide BX004]|nr:hypothetical protein AX14_002003 [Amanita brunnescens Koide BX004]